MSFYFVFYLLGERGFRLRKSLFGCCLIVVLVLVLYFYVGVL